MLTIFYKVLCIISGVYYGFSEFKTYKIRVILYCLSVIQAVTVSIACVLHTYYNEYYDMVQFTGSAIINIQHLLFVFIFMLMDKSVKLSVCTALFQNVDLKLKMDKTPGNFKTKKLVVVILLLVYRVILVSYLCSTGRCHEGVMKNIFYFFIYATRDMLMFNNAYLLYQIKCRLVRLAILVESADNDFTDTQLYHRLYKSISDICLQVKSAYDPVFITNLFGNMLDTMMIIYVQVENMKLYNTMRWELGDVAVITTWSITTLLTFLPAICGGALSTETDKIISILHRKLIDERDMQKVVQIEKFISYIEARPLKFTVYNVIPLDARLPGVVLHMCVTYLIVIIQFSHLG